MKKAPDSMAYVFLDNPEAVRLHKGLDGMSDVADPVAWHSRGDALIHAFLGYVKELGDLRAGISHYHRERAIRVIATVDQPNIDTDDVSGLQWDIIWYAMNDRIIWRRADRGWIRNTTGSVPKKGGNTSQLSDGTFRQFVQFRRGCTRLDGFLQQRNDLGQPFPAVSHDVEFPGLLELDTHLLTEKRFRRHPCGCDGHEYRWDQKAHRSGVS